jgi:hypothetical protein
VSISKYPGKNRLNYLLKAKYMSNASIACARAAASSYSSTAQNEQLSQSSQLQQQLEKEFKALSLKVRMVSDSSKEWLTLLKELNTAVKESGDLSNYGDIIWLSVSEICGVLGTRQAKD